MPPLETMQHNDDAFLTLLSSQRQLLSRLNMERACHPLTNNGAYPLPHASSAGPPSQYNDVHPFPPPSMMVGAAIRRGSIIGVDPLSLMNRPIIERRGSLDMMFSRRLSVGVGNDNFMYVDAPSADHKIHPEYYASTYSKAEHTQQEFDDTGASKKMKRRRSSMGLLHSMLFPEQDAKQSRRFSLTILPGGMMDDDQDRFADPDLQTFEKRPSCEHSKPQSSYSPNKRVRMIEPAVADPVIIKSTMVGFAAAMEKSLKSQQDIHDWDRKMGLKRSHSKTMRQSSRSRKKLRSVVKKDIQVMIMSSPSSLSCR
jgi:hypothetical protein